MTTTQYSQSAINANNNLLDKIGEKDDYNSSHCELAKFYDDLKEQIYYTEQELLTVATIETYTHTVTKGSLFHYIKEIIKLETTRVGFGIDSEYSSDTPINDKDFIRKLEEYTENMNSLSNSTDEFYSEL